MKSRPTKAFSPTSLDQKGRLAFLLNDAVVYGGAAAFSKSLALLTFPLLARNFTVAEYGSFDYFLVLSSLLTIFIVFGQDSAIARLYYDCENDKERREVVSQSFLFQLATLFLAVPCLWFFSEKIVAYLVGGDESEILLKIILAQSPFLFLIRFSQNLLKWTFQRTRFLVIALGYSAMNSLLIVLAAIYFDASVADVLFVGLGSSIVFAVVAGWFIRYWIVWPASFNRVKELVHFAAPVGAVCIIGAFSPTLERTLIANLLSQDDLGLYAAGMKITMLIGLGVNAFQTAWGPFAIAIYKEGDAIQSYNRILKAFTLAICVFAILLAVSAETLINLLASERYSAGSVVVFPITMGLGVQAIGWITEVGIGISKKTHLNVYAYLLFMSVTGLVIYLAAPILGLFGVAVGVMVGHLAKAMISSWLAQRVYPLDWQYGPVISVVALTTLVGLGINFSSNLIFGMQVALLIAAVLSITIFGWLMLFTPTERTAIQVSVMIYLQKFFGYRRN